MQDGDGSYQTVTRAELRELTAEVSELRKQQAQILIKIENICQMLDRVVNRTEDDHDTLLKHNGVINQLINHFKERNQDIALIQRRLGDVEVQLQEITTEIDSIKQQGERTFISRENLKVAIFSMMSSILAAVLTVLGTRWLG